jgi:hypothetical protein
MCSYLFFILISWWWLLTLLFSCFVVVSCRWIYLPVTFLHLVPPCVPAQCSRTLYPGAWLLLTHPSPSSGMTLGAPHSLTSSRADVQCYRMCAWLYPFSSEQNTVNSLFYFCGEEVCACVCACLCVWNLKYIFLDTHTKNYEFFSLEVVSHLVCTSCIQTNFDTMKHIAILSVVCQSCFYAYALNLCLCFVCGLTELCVLASDFIMEHITFV